MVNETNDNGIRAWLRSPEIRLHFQSGPGQTFTQCYSCDERKGRGGEKRTRKMGVTVTFMQTTDGGHWFREDVLVFLRGNKKYKWKPHTQDIVAGCTMSWATRFDHQPSKYTLEEHKYIFVSSVKAREGLCASCTAPSVHPTRAKLSRAQTLAPFWTVSYMERRIQCTC